MTTTEQSSSSTLAMKTYQSECFQCDNHSERIFKRLQARLDLCDVVLIVGCTGKRISAHRLILIASSDYFSALLSGPMRESQELEITLNEVDGDALEKLVNFCYTGSLELRVDTIEALLTTANYLQFNEVFEHGLKFLHRHLQPSNCLDVFFFAQQLNFEELQNKAWNIICEHFAGISKDPKILLLNAKQLSQLIARDDLDVPSEGFVFDVLMKWIEYEPELRRKHFAELLAVVRLPLLPPTFLAEKVEPLCNTMESKKLVLKALKSQLVPERQLSIQHRKGLGNLLLVIYARYIRHIDSVVVEGYNLYTKKWTKWNTPMEHRRNFASVRMDDNVIMVGGEFPEFQPLNTVTRLNLHTMALTQMPPMRKSRSGASVAVLNGFIYVIGGSERSQTLNSVERWDPDSQNWRYVAPMKNERYSAGVAVSNGLLYVSGGRWKVRGNIVKSLTSVECYDPVEDVWIPRAPLLVERFEHCLAAHNGYLYAVGGLKKRTPISAVIERYHPRTDKWTMISCLPKLKKGLTRCASLGPNLFIYNGSNFYRLANKDTDDMANVQLQRLPKPNSCNGTYVSPQILCFSGAIPPDSV